MVGRTTRRSRASRIDNDENSEDEHHEPTTQAMNSNSQTSMDNESSFGDDTKRTNKKRKSEFDTSSSSNSNDIIDENQNIPINAPFSEHIIFRNCTVTPLHRLFLHSWISIKFDTWTNALKLYRRCCESFESNLILNFIYTI